MPQNADVGPVIGVREISAPGGDDLYDYIEPENHEEEDACEDPVDPLEWDSYDFQVILRSGSSVVESSSLSVCRNKAL
uniref:Uncharacterized protein n=1 Tax=Oryza rufipogon TaxID=4529 RepID=A0A0E0NJV9_ORYRU